uniref:Immunoglobulin V-set domain-containing protein n=1 Tax=Myripristis murdjan TaxID=586833 RepID=A0A667X1Z9_9TELE
MVLEVSGHVGGEVSILCSGKWSTDSSSNNYNMYLCKGVCSSKNILVQTDWKKSSVTQRGRYGMRVNRRDGVFTVTIKRLEKADAGIYHCGLERTFKVMYQEVNLKCKEKNIVKRKTLSKTQLGLPRLPRSRNGYESY